MGCSGTIARLRSEDVKVRILTFSLCDDLNDGEVMMREWVAATDALTVTDRTIWDIPNRRFPEYRQDILDLLDDEVDGAYDIVFTPMSTDTHQDHSTVTAEAIRVFKRTTILGYELPMNSIKNGHVSCFVHLNAIDMDMKHVHAATYESQKDKPYMDPHFIDGLASVRGVQCGTEMAEAFEVIRWVL